MHRRSGSAAAFAAVADPTRRRILELLRDTGERNAGDVAAEFPRISRAAVSKHLQVLRRARLVRSRTHGRECRYTLNARPLAEMYREWLLSFAPYWEESLARLKRAAEDSG